MGYPASVDTGLVQLDVLTHGSIIAAQTIAATVAGAAFLCSVVIGAGEIAILTKMRCDFSGSPTGQCDMGIYDASGANNAPNNLLGHTGAIAAATGVFTQPLTQTLVLGPGIYWLAVLDTVADSIITRTEANNGMAPTVRTSATNLTVLPATLGAVSNNTLYIVVLGLTQNGWS